MTKVEEQLTNLSTKTSLGNMSRIEHEHLLYCVKLFLRQIANVMTVVGLNVDVFVDAVMFMLATMLILMFMLIFNL